MAGYSGMCDLKQVQLKAHVRFIKGNRASELRRPIKAAGEPKQRARHRNGADAGGAVRPKREVGRGREEGCRAETHGPTGEGVCWPDSGIA
jgi:hypothetical protein